MNEATTNQLYRSTVAAFPRTKARQHLVYTIEMQDIKYTPFVGVNTLLVRGTAINEDHETSYNPLVLFKNVKYVEKKNDESVSLWIQGKTYYFETPTKKKNDILVRCQCEDFNYRFKYYDHLDKALYGHKGKKYQRVTEDHPPANPLQLPGCCKHCLKLVEYLGGIGILI